MKIELSEELKVRLQDLSACTNKTKNYYIEEALKAYLEVYEQDLKALALYERHVKEGSLKTYPLEEGTLLNGNR